MNCKGCKHFKQHKDFKRVNNLVLNEDLILLGECTNVFGAGYVYFLKESPCKGERYESK